MATARKTLKSQKARYHEKIIDTPPPRRKCIPGSGSDYSESEEEEEYDEPDRCTTTKNQRGSDELFLDTTTPRRTACVLVPETTIRERAACTSTKTSTLPLQKARKLNTSEAESGEPRTLEVPVRHNGATPILLIGMCVIVTGMLTVFAVVPFMNSSASLNTKGLKTKDMEEIYGEMEIGLKGLHKKFHQTSRFWIQIMAQLRQVTEPSPLQPAVLLGLVPLDSRKAAACLSQQLLGIVASAFDDPKYISFDTVSHSWSNASALKRDLDAFLGGLSSVHAAAVHNLERIDPEAAMIFHAYCDNDNAPYKRALILLTLDVEAPYSSVDESRLDAAAHDLLTRLWSAKMRDVDAAAVVSRVANAPVVFRPEESSLIDELCPF